MSNLKKQRLARRGRVTIKFTEPTLTKQSFKDECNINLIMAKYQKSGAITHLQNHEGSYGFASAVDFTESMQIVTKANSMFADLPSSIRTKFENEPAKFLEFVQNPENAKELVELGLATPRTPTPSKKEKTAPEPTEEAETPKVVEK